MFFVPFVFLPLLIFFLSLPNSLLSVSFSILIVCVMYSRKSDLSNNLPAMNDSRSSFRIMIRLKMSSERQDLCRVERNTVVWPRHEMKLLNTMFFVTLGINVNLTNIRVTVVIYYSHIVGIHVTS